MLLNAPVPILIAPMGGVVQLKPFLNVRFQRSPCLLQQWSLKKQTPIALVLHVANAIRPPPASLAIVTSLVEAGRFEIQDILIFFKL